MYYKVGISLGESDGISYRFAAILDTDACPSLVRKDQLLASLDSEMRMFRSSLRSQGDTTRSGDGFIILCVYVGRQIASVLREIATTLATTTILGKACTNELTKRIQTDKRIVVSKKDGTVRIVAFYTTDGVTQI